MVGSVFGEFAMMPLPFHKEEIEEKALTEMLQKRFGTNTESLIELFKKAYPNKNLADLFTLDTVFRVPTKEFICTFAKEGGKVYPYLFALEFPYQHGKTAWHCTDIPFIFHTTDRVPVANIPEVSDRLETQMFEAFMRFARTGNPNGEGIPQWTEATAKEQATMIFDRTCEVRQNFDDELIDLYVASSPKFNLMEMMADMGDSFQH